MRYLGCIGTVSRYEKARRVRDGMSIPTNFSCLFRQQAQKHAQERGLARGNAPGDDRERTARQAQADVFDTAPGVGIVVGEARCLQRLKAVSLGFNPIE